VKLCIRLLDQLRLAGARELSDDEIAALVRGEEVLLLEEIEEEPDATFLGLPLKKKPKKS